MSESQMNELTHQVADALERTLGTIDRNELNSHLEAMLLSGYEMNVVDDSECETVR